jgi:crossover junction endodeoxyribonuclease RusA
MAKIACNQVLLPWPPKVLSPNARAHWATRSKAAKSYRNRCFLGAKQVGLAAPAGRLLLVVEFLPPNRQRRDDDNLIAAFKSGRDGLADALGIDDCLFVTQCHLSSEVHQGGAVRVTLRPFVAVVD